MAYDSGPSQALENVSVEASVISACLFELSAVEAVSGLLKPEHFSHGFHADLFRWICQHAKETGSGDAALAAYEYFSRTEWNSPSLMHSISDLADRAAFGPEIMQNAHIIKDLATKRHLRDLFEESRIRIASTNKPEEIITDAIQKLYDLEDQGGVQDLWKVSADFEDTALEPLPEDRLLSGPWTDLNDTLRFKRGEMHLIAGRPGMGKSAFGVDLAYGLAKNGHGVALFSLEMDGEDILRRASCNEAFERGMGCTHKDSPFYQSLMAGTCTPEQRRRAVEGYRAIKRLPVFIQDKRGQTIAQIASACRRLKRIMSKEPGLELRTVIIDHVGKIRPSTNRNGSKYAEATDISNALHDLSKELDVALIGLSQLNREVEKRGGNRPQLSDLRETGAWEEDAYSVSFLYRPEYYFERQKREDGHLDEDALKKLDRCKNRLDVIVEKHRNGAVGTVPLYCDIRANAIRDPRHEEWRAAA